MERTRKILTQGILPDDQIVVPADILAIGSLGRADGKRDRPVHHPVTRTDLEPGEGVVTESSAASRLDIGRHVEHRQPQVNGLVVLLRHQHGVPVHLLVLAFATRLGTLRSLGVLLVFDMGEITQLPVVDQCHDTGPPVGRHP